MVPFPGNGLEGGFQAIGDPKAFHGAKGMPEATTTQNGWEGPMREPLDGLQRYLLLDRSSRLEMWLQHPASRSRFDKVERMESQLRAEGVSRIGDCLYHWWRSEGGPTQ